MSLWDEISGSCQISGNCISDGSGSGEYSNSESCTIHVTSALVATASFFDTESYYDKITIGGTEYSGNEGPVNVYIAAGQTMTWSSDVDWTNRYRGSLVPRVALGRGRGSAPRSPCGVRYGRTIGRGGGMRPVLNKLNQ